MFGTFIAVLMIVSGLIWFGKIWFQKGQPNEWEPRVAGALIVFGAIKLLAGF